MDWRRFTFDFDMESGKLLHDLITIEAYKQAVLNLVLPPEWRERLDRLNRVRVVRGTTALEGNPLSEEEVSRQLERNDIDTGRATKEQLQIRNAGSAQMWVRERFLPESAPLCCEDLLRMHEMITTQSDTHNNVPGRWRNFSVQVGTPDLGGVHLGAPHDKLPWLMEEFTKFVNGRKIADQHPVIRALLAHFFLVTIHPFGDGNGRVSRLVEAGIFFQQGYNVHGFYGLSNYFYQHEEEYKILLQRCRERQPFVITPFIEFGVAGFASELRGINNFIKAKLNRIIYRDMVVRAHNRKISKRRRLLNEREYGLLDFLLIATEPIDPFSDIPSERIRLSELREAGYIRGAYRGFTSRTFVRELLRLREFGFIKFARDEEAADWVVEIDFNAIGKL